MFVCISAALLFRTVISKGGFSSPIEGNPLFLFFPNDFFFLENYLKIYISIFNL